ncbi:DUF6943 family protein [Aurantibacillus circumpalustris]|uniref:DUF6943 family protein n=1 Tax=Aurantibacillus circumpalustris TaxID=3036359 RepID=UPI00295AA74D|nr:hypothetical protein [Aurantibacillus circumpalustris]
MLKTKIKCHKLGMQYTQPHFFILNKGFHSGKPAPEYWSNCFVFLADCEEEREFFYFLILGLWELQLFLPHLTGSVVQFIRINDFIDIVEECVNHVNTGERKFEDIQNSLKQIEQCKVTLQKQVATLMQLRKSIFHSYLKKK